jgi:gamma-glutamylputrescine oxidase
MTGYLTANDTPGAHPRSWYLETAAALPDHPALEGTARADVCIVGGGYAGLSSALHLAGAGLDVVLLEANRVGWGASGRNGGQLGVGPRASMEKYVKALGRDDARKVWDIAVEANGLVRALIARHGIRCDLRDGGLEAAWKPSHAAEMRAWPETAAREWGHDAARWVPREELAELIGTARYHGGVLDRTAGHLHPLNLALGLARAAEAAGARLFERSPATGVAPGRVTTEAGTVEAEQVLVACNGYLDGLDRRVARQSMPINNFIAVTEPLRPPRAHRLNREDLAVADSKFVLNYFRLTPDRRMLWGGGESYSRRFPADIAGLVRRKMLEVYPDLADLKMTHAWGGTLAITASRMPAFRDLGGGVLAISGWSGSGIHMATMGGKIAAEAIRGRVERWDLLERVPTPTFPGGDWFRAPLLAAAMTWYALRDRL